MGETLCEPESETAPIVEREADAAFVEDQVRDELLPSVIEGEFALMPHDAPGTVVPPPPPPKPGEDSETAGRLDDCELVAPGVVCVVLSFAAFVVVFPSLDPAAVLLVSGPK